MDLLLNSDWDLELQGGDLVLAEKSDAIAQHVKQRLWIFKGEYFLDENEGVPYYQSILGKKPDLNLVSAILLDTISNTPGILEVNEFDVDYNASTRTFQITEFKARALDGVVDFGSIDLAIKNKKEPEV